VGENSNTYDDRIIMLGIALQKIAYYSPGVIEQLIVSKDALCQIVPQATPDELAPQSLSARHSGDLLINP